MAASRASCRSREVRCGPSNSNATSLRSADLRHIAAFVLVEVDVDVISRAVESSVHVSDAIPEVRQSHLIALQRQTRRYDEPVPVALMTLIELGESNLFGALESASRERNNQSHDRRRSRAA